MIHYDLLKKLAKQFGRPVNDLLAMSPAKLADTRTEAVPLHVRADQSPPLPQHSYATRRRAR